MPIVYVDSKRGKKVMTLEEVRAGIDAGGYTDETTVSKTHGVWETCSRSKSSDRRRCICSRKRT